MNKHLMKRLLPISLPSQRPDLDSLDVHQLTSSYRNNNPQYFKDAGFKKALEVFHDAAEHVPAYKDFLKKNNIDHKKVKTYSDFQQVPVVDKKNYLRAYNLKDLCWNGNFNNLHTFSSSSGSTGEPFLWPRGERQEIEGGLIHEVLLKNFFHIDKNSTLFINCFSMGTWIAGLFTLTSIMYLSKKRYPIISITPGLETELMFNLFSRLANQFDQIIICGYPPFVKDLLDQGTKYDIDWKKYKIMFLFAAEGFSEKWRDHIHTLVGSNDPLLTSINIYGSADATILGFETPLTTAIRKVALNNQDQLQSLFSDTRLPTLVQYDPRIRFFEEINNSLIFTARSGIPLIRYRIGDTGGIYTYDDLNHKMKHHNTPIESLLENDYKQYLWKLPFLYLFGRSDLTISFYGVLIYPEHIKHGLENSSLEESISGKFVVTTEYDHDQNQYILLRIELLNGIKATEILRSKILKAIVTGLKEVNSEYAKLYEVLQDKALPTIELIENGNTEYFKIGAKQKWIIKNELV